MARFCRADRSAQFFGFNRRRAGKELEASNASLGVLCYLISTIRAACGGAKSGLHLKALTGHLSPLDRPTVPGAGMSRICACPTEISMTSSQTGISGLFLSRLAVLPAAAIQARGAQGREDRAPAIAQGPCSAEIFLSVSFAVSCQGIPRIAPVP